MATLRAYLQLVRLPAVFTAVADILLGFLLRHSSLRLDGCLLPFSSLLAASCCLYLAGMAFNDIFDRHVDARERPQRPLPSGRISVRAAVLFGSGLLLAGIGFSAVAGLSSLIIAGLLMAAIFAYDGWLKNTVIGPPMMGTCRFLNVLLGSSAGVSLTGLWNGPTFYVALGLGVYIAGLTWFARHEAETSSRSQLIPAAAVINAGLLWLLLLAMNVELGWSSGLDSAAPWQRVVFAWALVVLVINRGLFAAIAHPAPQLVQRGVKTMLQWYIVLGAVLIYAATGEPAYALLTAFLLLPALLLGRWVYVT